MLKPYWRLLLESTTISQVLATGVAAQPTLARSEGADDGGGGSLNLKPLWRACNCASQPNLKRANPASALLCRDAPWRCPFDVPPACNTGVHTPVKKRTALPSRKRQLDLFEVAD